jgi:hypothetical protein
MYDAGYQSGGCAKHLLSPPQIPGDSNAQRNEGAMSSGARRHKPGRKSCSALLIRSHEMRASARLTSSSKALGIPYL